MADLLHHRSATDVFGDPIDSQPLWFKKNDFLQDNFDSESYIANLRTFVPFDSLRSELQSHLSSLKHELVELINRDYADFVNLSTKLVDVHGAIVRMRAPLTELREKISQFRASTESSLAALQNGLRQRTEASAAREILELLLDTFHVVSKVEKLIKELPTVHADWSNGEVTSTEKGSLSNGTSLQHAENGMSLRETQSMLLERIASEMNRLKFYIANAQVSFAISIGSYSLLIDAVPRKRSWGRKPRGVAFSDVDRYSNTICRSESLHIQNLPFIENMEKRIQSASLLLDASLGHCFVDGLEHRDANAIYNCLRAYAAIDNTRGAEEIFRTTVVSPLIQKIIPYSSSPVVVGASGDDLKEDYEQIMQCIGDCKFLLEISSAANSGLHVFDFLANSILKEVLWAIQKGKPGAFSPGRPTEFLKNYKSSLGFLAYLEGYCPSRSAVTQFRAEAVYTEFLKQWNIGVYFSLRFQEIAGTLDSALVVAALTPVQISHSDEGNPRDLTLKQSVTLLESLRSCWREDVLVLYFSDKFLRLSLQLLSRYSTWLSFGLAARKAGNTGSNPGSEWAISAVPEDFIYGGRSVRSRGRPGKAGGSGPEIRVGKVLWCLRPGRNLLEGSSKLPPLTGHLWSEEEVTSKGDEGGGRDPDLGVEVVFDIDCLVKELSGDYLGHVLQILASCSTEVLDLVKQSILQGGNALKDLVPLIMNTMIEALVEKSVEDLRQLKGITATYRLTNKPLPVRHSPYVSGVLRPLKAFLDGERAAMYLTKEAKNELLQGAVEEITGRYYELAADLVNVSRKTESSLQRIRQGAQRRGTASSDVSDHNLSNTDKICMQLFLDIQEYGRNLSALGIAAENIPAFRSLWQCVAPPDRQSTIKF
ncbi:hypothetical protein HHK36_025149 [Tetracentron sinense]|uniref:Conserved oligomeric Golgi complex subunit 2 n=1 Tax=Tetracentron sinense TaxID=13715 RepID=A0A834YRC2_TETSI|nr:hypothetical protein HHK36_025149 [Tetracentron sinense]